MRTVDQGFKYVNYLGAVTHAGYGLLWAKVVNFSIFFRVISMALGQSYDCPNHVITQLPVQYPRRIWVKSMDTLSQQTHIFCIIFELYSVVSTPYRNCKKFWAFTGPKRNFGLILLISNMIIHGGFYRPTHTELANVRGLVSYSVSVHMSCHDTHPHTVYPKKYAHGFVVLCFVVVMQSFIMNSHEVFIHIHQGCFAGTGAIVMGQSLDCPSASEVSLMDMGKSVNV